MFLFNKNSPPEAVSACVQATRFMQHIMVVLIFVCLVFPHEASYTLAVVFIHRHIPFHALGRTPRPPAAQSYRLRQTQRGCPIDRPTVPYTRGRTVPVRVAAAFFAATLAVDAGGAPPLLLCPGGRKSGQVFTQTQYHQQRSTAVFQRPPLSTSPIPCTGATASPSDTTPISRSKTSICPSVLWMPTPW